MAYMCPHFLQTTTAARNDVGRVPVGAMRINADRRHWTDDYIDAGGNGSVDTGDDFVLLSRVLEVASLVVCTHGKPHNCALPSDCKVWPGLRRKLYKQ